MAMFRVSLGHPIPQFSASNDPYPVTGQAKTLHILDTIAPCLPQTSPLPEVSRGLSVERIH